MDNAQAYDGGGRRLSLRDTGRGGGEGHIHSIEGDPSSVVKLLHVERMNRETIDKLHAMLANPPTDPTLRVRRHHSIAWPTGLVYSDPSRARPVGFLMPRLDEDRFRPAHTYFDPSDRIARFGGAYTWRHLLIGAYNLASAVAAIHAKGHRVGDLRDSNILVAPNSLITLIDCDSFEIHDGDRVYPTRVGAGEYLPPELQRADFSSASIDRYHSDLFALAVLVFRFLMGGTHPFQAKGPAVAELPSVETKIAAGTYPYVHSRGLHPPAYAPPIRALPHKVLKLAKRAFVDGHRDPSKRPSATEWFDALQAEGPRLRPCRVNLNHISAGHLRTCPWCEMARAGNDPFPSPEIGSQSATAEPPEVRHPVRTGPVTVRRKSAVGPASAAPASATMTPTSPAVKPRDLATLRGLLEQRRSEETSRSGTLPGELAFIGLTMGAAAIAPWATSLGAVVLILPLLATAGRIAEWRRREEGPVKLLLMSPPFFLQAITQSLYHLVPVALVAVPILIAAWWGLTRFSPLPEEVVIQGLAALASGAWLLAAFRFIDRDDNRLIGPTAGSLRGLSAKAFRTRLGRVKVVLLAPIALAALAWLRYQGFQTTWPF
jgi:hypothetical protein